METSLRRPTERPSRPLRDASARGRWAQLRSCVHAQLGLLCAGKCRRAWQRLLSRRSASITLSNCDKGGWAGWARGRLRTPHICDNVKEPFSPPVVDYGQSGPRRKDRQPANPMEVFMSRWMLAAATATLICASSSAALADQSGAVTGGVAGAVGGAVVGGPVGAVVGGVGGAAIGNSMSNHHRYYHHHYADYHHHYNHY
jgi:hypothetical protein